MSKRRLAESVTNGFRRTGERQVHQGYVWSVAVAEFVDPDGGTFTRDIVRSPGAVGVVPLVFDAEGNPSVVLVSQYRPPYERPIIEIPAGMRDIEGEEPIEVARRELVEEAGLSAGNLQLLTEIYPSPGMTDSITSIFLATDCTPTEFDRHGPEEDHMELLHLPLADAMAMVVSGEIADAKTVVGLLLAERQLAASG
jgi:nudix-type nucleoside diphosphatase (YffH/AdpP family)